MLSFILLASVFFSSNSGIADKYFAQFNEDKSTVDFLYNKAWDYHDIGLYDSALFYAEIQEKIAKKINYELGIINAHYVKGVAYNKNNFFDLSAKELYDGLVMIKENSDSTYLRKKTFMLQCLGVSYERAKDLDHALNYYQEALDIAKKINLKSSIAVLLYNIGVIYDFKKNYGQSLKYYNSSLRLNQSLNDSIQMAIVNNSIGNIYNREGEYEKAKECYLVALNLALKVKGLKKEKAFYVSNLGVNAFKQGHIEQALNFYNKALSICENLKDIDKTKAVCNNLGEIYLTKKNYNKAIDYYKKTISLGKNQNIDYRLQTAYKNIAQAYEHLNQFQLALDYQSKYIAQADKIVTIKDNLSEQNAQYRMKEVDWQRKLMQAQLKAAEDRVLYLSIISALSLIILSFIAWRLFRHYRLYKNAREILGEPIAVED